jgi:hypothetical protein
VLGGTMLFYTACGKTVRLVRARLMQSRKRLSLAVPGLPLAVLRP